MSQQAINQDLPYPLPQPAYLKIAGRFFSYLFHPLFIPVYVSAYLIYLHPYAFALFDSKQKFIRLLSVFVITTFFPSLTVFLLWRLQFAASIFLRTQKERIIPYIASIIYFFWAFYVAKNLEGTPTFMVAFFLGIFLTASAASMANSYFKVSMHALGVGGAAMFLILLGTHSQEPMGLVICIATLTAGLVCTSRMLVSDHYPADIYCGLILSSLSQVVAWLVIV